MSTRTPRPRRPASLVLAGVVLALLGVLTAATPASASSATALADLMGTEDPSGHQITDYQLAVDDGGWSGRTTGQSISAWLLTSAWDNYRFTVGVALWLYEQARALTWLEVVRAPLEQVATVLEQVVDELGLIPLFAVIAAVIAGAWARSGRYGTAGSQFAIALVLSVLAGGILANPVAVLTDENGALSTAQDIGLEISDRVSAGPVTYGPPAPGDSQIAPQDEGVSSQLIDLFVRTPHQVLNYGSVISPRCVEAYDRSLDADDTEEAREIVGDCDEAYAEAAAAPGDALPTMTVIAPGAGVLLLLLVTLTAVLMIATLGALWQAVMLVVNLVKGILPAQGRLEFWQCLFQILSWLLVMVLALVGVGLYVRLLQVVLNTAEWGPLQTFLIVDILMLIAAGWLVSMVIKNRKAGKKWGKRVSDKTSPTPVAPKTPSPVATMVQSAAGQGLAMAGNRAIGGVGSALTSGAGARGGTFSGAGSGGPTPTVTQRAAGAARLTGKGAMLATKVALGSTVGLPVYAPRVALQAASAASSASTAMRAKLAASKARASAGVADRVGQARDFGQEYAHNVAVAGRVAGKYSGATAAGRAVGKGATTAAGAAAAASVAPRVAAQLRRPAGANPSATQAAVQELARRRADADARTSPASPAAPTAVSTAAPVAPSPVNVPGATGHDEVTYDRLTVGQRLRQRAQTAWAASPLGSTRESSTPPAAAQAASSSASTPPAAPPAPGAGANDGAAAARVSELRARLAAARGRQR
ncbi:hypothetical protein [uncultured Pseudokineococcus sp.]|uniref:hypothetical protein n=1 Tax=uncultured Pseudokineococcus sp. TaxID=1642928 RepID=UPI00261E5610|nr:hypothetical protein [uncultured Pseudokineococcus sp.]